jgi:glycosyltransferase involved in cell wall biosynthesis
LRYAERVIAVSQSVLNQLPQHSKLTLVYDELPIEEKYPDLTVSDASKSVFIFLYLSNFIKGKGQDFALEAFGKVHYQLPDWKLRFVGGDMGLKKNLKYKESLKQRAIKLGIFEKTEWVSFTEDVELEYKHADIVLNFSESESFSITCLEALSFGRPVIATDCGGPREIIDHEETGLLVANRDINSMVNAMMKLALDRKSRLTMGIEAKKRMKIKFGSGKTIETIQTVFDTALKQK